MCSVQTAIRKENCVLKQVGMLHQKFRTRRFARYTDNICLSVAGLVRNASKMTEDVKKKNDRDDMLDH